MNEIVMPLFEVGTGPDTGPEISEMMFQRLKFLEDGEDKRCDAEGKNFAEKWLATKAEPSELRRLAAESDCWDAALAEYAAEDDSSISDELFKVIKGEIRSHQEAANYWRQAGIEPERLDSYLVALSFVTKAIAIWRAYLARRASELIEIPELTN